MNRLRYLRYYLGAKMKLTFIDVPLKYKKRGKVGRSKEGQVERPWAHLIPQMHQKHSYAKGNSSLWEWHNDGGRTVFLQQGREEETCPEVAGWSHGQGGLTPCRAPRSRMGHHKLRGSLRKRLQATLGTLALATGTGKVSLLNGFESQRSWPGEPEGCEKPRSNSYTVWMLTPRSPRTGAADRCTRAPASLPVSPSALVSCTLGTKYRSWWEPG